MAHWSQCEPVRAAADPSVIALDGNPLKVALVEAFSVKTDQDHRTVAAGFGLLRDQR